MKQTHCLEHHDFLSDQHFELHFEERDESFDHAFGTEYLPKAYVLKKIKLWCPRVTDDWIDVTNVISDKARAHFETRITQFMEGEK